MERGIKMKNKIEYCIKSMIKDKPFLKFTIPLVFFIFILWIFPFLAEFYAFLVRNKTNPSQMNLSRSEFIKIIISLISPILSYVVLRNTVNIQRESIKRRNIDDVNRDFYGLIGIFNKQQQEHRQKISEFYVKTITDKRGFKHGYPSRTGYRPKYQLWNEEEKEWVEKFYSEHAHTEKPDSLSDTSKVSIIINRQFDSVYHELSSYFKVLHRILKILNEKLETQIIDEDIYLNYIGILRAQISSQELVVILVNSLYGCRGLGLGIELIGSDFFGDERDFMLEQHFDFPNPQIVSDNVKEFVLDKSSNMMGRRINLRNIQKNNSNEQLLNNKTNFNIFSKRNQDK